MTARSIEQIIASTRHLLLDFDGPVCSVFAGMTAAEAADRLRTGLASSGMIIPAEAMGLKDPLEVFRTVAAAGQQEAMRAQELLTVLEIRAVSSAKPTEGSEELIRTAHQSGRSIGIVSNNSGAAIATYLANMGLRSYVQAVAGRDSPDPDKMKPDPYLVLSAIEALGAQQNDCVMIGDSTSDVRAGQFAGIPVIGYASNPGKTRTLAMAHAVATTDRLNTITAAILDHPL